MLGFYAFVVYWKLDSYLGVVGLGSTIIYDAFILTFNSLQVKYRTLPAIFIMVFLGRFLSFIFGINYWLFGYCLITLLIGILRGIIIIDRRLPLKFESKTELKLVNAIRTPEFSLLVLTV